MQFGFRKHRSTTEAVLMFIQDTLEAMERKQCVCSKFFDLSRAFDTVSHDVLIEKLKYFGFCDNAVALIGSYLSNRQQAVYFNDLLSEFKLTPHGVPQGSILGPLLFIIYVNDLPYNVLDVNVSCFMYADDVCLNFKTHKNIQNNIINNTVDTMVDWCKANKLALNLGKTQNLEITYDSSKNVQTPVKFLGVIIQSNMKWNSHIDYIVPKVSKGIFMLRKLKLIVSTDVLLTVYFSYVHCHLLYSSILWANCNYAKSLFVLQKRAVRLISGVPPRTHCRPIFKRLCVMPLACIYIFQCLLFVKSNLSLFTCNKDVHNYATRNRNKIQTEFCQYATTQASFKYNAIKLYNKLPVNVNELPLNNFKIVTKKFLLDHCFYSIEEFFESGVEFP